MENHFTESESSYFLAPRLLVYFTESEENHFSLKICLAEILLNSAKNQLYSSAKRTSFSSITCTVIAVADNNFKERAVSLTSQSSSFGILAAAELIN